MPLVSIFLLLVGAWMLWKPKLVWQFTERWKSPEAEEPSALYVWSIRFGGALCTLAGLGSAAAYVLAL